MQCLSWQLSPGTPFLAGTRCLHPSTSAVPTSCQPGEPAGNLGARGGWSHCALPGSASRPPLLPPRPSNGWVMSAGGAGGGAGRQVPQALAPGAANQVCQRHLSSCEHLGLKVTLSPSVTIMSLASVLKPASRPGRGGLGWVRGCTVSPVPGVWFPGVV